MGCIDSENGKYRGPNGSASTWDYQGESDEDGGIIADFTANGYRLPTEAEWEYIARGGNNGIPGEQTVYSGSSNIDAVAWYKDNSRVNNSVEAHEVKTKAKNTLDIFEMSGNVWEWCYDWYSDIDSNTGSAGAVSGLNRVLRGGAYNMSATSCTVSLHYGYFPYYCEIDYGFRVVRNAE